MALSRIKTPISLTLITVLGLTALIGCSNNDQSHGSKPIASPSQASTQNSGASFTSKPMTEVTAEEQSSLNEIEKNTRDSLNNIIAISMKQDPSFDMIDEIEATSDPEEVKKILAKYRPFIDEVNQSMTVDPEINKINAAEALNKKGIEDPKTINEIAVVIEYIIFANELYKPGLDPKLDTIEIIPGTFRTVAGKTLLQGDSIYAKDENGGIVYFAWIHNNVILENQGKVLNFDEYHKGSARETASKDKTWVTDFELYQEFKSLKNKYENDPDHVKSSKYEVQRFAEYLKQNFKYGGAFEEVVVGEKRYIKVTHPASVLGKNGDVLYRFD